MAWVAAVRRSGFMSLSTLYLCYFGLREPLVQKQVLPYLRQLVDGGIKVHLLTFEPHLSERWSADELDEQQDRLRAEGISWFGLPYHKSPSVPGTLYDIIAGARFARKLVLREGIDVLHARAHVPLAMALLACKGLPRVRIIFDIRGLMAEEYEDSGIWRRTSATFRGVKKLERSGLKRADGVVVLTRRMRDWLVSERLADAEKIQVIPCCVDLSQYEPVAAVEVNDLPTRFEVVYAGSATGLYMLQEMGQFFRELRALCPGAFFRILTMSSPEQVSSVLRRVGLDEVDFQVAAVPATEVPGLLRRARVGISFRKPTFSQIAASPTKIPEYLAAGLPVVSNEGIGDTDELLKGERIGVIVRSFNNDSLADAAKRILALAGEANISTRCRAAALRHFDLASVGGAGYLNLYRRLTD